MSNQLELNPKYIETYIRQTKLLQRIGIHIFNEPNTSLIRKYGRLIFFAGLLISIFTGQILYVVKGNEIGANVLDIVNSIPSLFTVLQNLVKLIVLTLKRTDIREIVMDIGKLWPNKIESEEKEQEMNILMRRLRICDKVLNAATVVALFFFGLGPLAHTVYQYLTQTNAEYQFIVRMYYFCYLKSHLTYFAVYTYQFVMCCLCQLCLYVACDYLLVDLAVDLIVLLRFVHIDLRNLLGASNLQYLQNNADDNCQDIVSIAKTHKSILSLTQKLSNIFGEIIFSQIYFSSVIICCYGFMVVFQLKDGILLTLGNLTAALGIMFIILVIALPGQMLADMSSGVADAAYQCHWYERSKKFRKYIVIIIVRAQKPAHLSALGFSDLSLVMFSKVVSTSWSYLSLLNQMSEKFDV